MLNLVILAIPLLQNTITVDAANGPGTNFLDIPPAVAAAQSGDTILVRAGSYSGFNTNKSLSVIGAGAATTQVVGLGSAIILNGTSSFLIAGLETRGGTTATFGGVTIWNGNLTLLDCELHGKPNVGSPGLAAFDSVVHASRSLFQGSDSQALIHLTQGGGPGAILSGSMLSAELCTFQGGAGLSGGFGGSAGPGLRVWGGDVVLSRCDGFGGVSASATGGTAVECSAGHVRIAGTATNSMQGGSSVTLAAMGGAIEVHGAINILPPIGGAATTAGAVTLGSIAIPHLSVQGTALANGELDATQLVTVTYDGLVANAPFFFMVGFAPNYQVATSANQLGPLLIEQSTAGLVFGTLDPAGQFSFSLLPAVVLAPLLGLPIYSQAGTFDATNTLLRTSNANIERYGL